MAGLRSEALGNCLFKELPEMRSLEGGDISLKVVAGHVEVSGASTVAVYDMAGHKMAESAVLPQGLYVVVADGERHLISVK